MLRTMTSRWLAGAFSAVLVGVGTTLAADAPKKAPKPGAYRVDPKQSTIKWVGKKVTGQHEGTVQFKDGELAVSDGNLTSGQFSVDMTSIKVTDLKDPDSNGKLTGHLKSDDFFGVEKHPTATFKLGKVEPLTDGKDGATHTVSGTLTIKGKENPVSFPATVKIEPTKITAQATNVEIDRTLYGIRYGSGKFFQNLGDKMIDDKFWLNINLVALK